MLIYIKLPSTLNWASLVAQTVKSLPTVRATWVQSLGGDDPLEKEMANHSSILALEILWTEESDGLQSSRWGHKRVEHDLVTKQHLNF